MRFWLGAGFAGALALHGCTVQTNVVLPGDTSEDRGDDSGVEPSDSGQDDTSSGGDTSDTFDTGEPTCSIDDCEFKEICHKGECTEALDRKYFVTIVGVEVAKKNYEGKDWDPGGEAPDLFVSLGLVNSAGTAWEDRCNTLVAENVFAYAWQEGCEFVFKSGAHFRIEMWDDDQGSVEIVGTFDANGNDELLQALRQPTETLSVSNDVFTMYVKFEPRF